MVTIHSQELGADGATPRGGRVLFLAARLGAGGVTTHMASLGQALRRRGWEVAVASAGASTGHVHDVRWIEQCGLRHYQLVFPQAANMRNMLRIPAAACHAMQITSRFRPDLVHVHWRSTSWCAQFMEWCARLPFVVTVHATIPSDWRRRRLSFWGSKTIAVSPEIREHLIEVFGLSRKRIRVISNGVDEQYYRPATNEKRCAARRSLGLHTADPLVCLIGSGWRVKGHDVLIRAIGILRAAGRPIRALIAGAALDIPVLQSMAEEQGVADLVHFLGYADSRTVLWASDVMALPSRAEGLPIAVIEAMLCGVVPVRTPAGGAKDQVIHGETGFLVPFDDAAALADRLSSLCEDPVRRRLMGEAAMDHARRHFSLSRMTDQIVEVYANVLGRGHNGFRAAESADGTNASER